MALPLHLPLRSPELARRRCGELLAFRVAARPPRFATLVWRRPHLRRTAVRAPSTAAQRTPRQTGGADDASTDGGAWRTFWASVDAGAWVGTVGATLAFLLTQEALLVAGPVLLPLLALYASRQRQRLDSRAAQVETHRQVEATLRRLTSLSEESAAQVASQLAAAAEQVRQGRAAPAKGIAALDAKLSSVEGSVLSVRAAAREALSEAAAQQGRSAREVSAALGALRRDLGSDIKQAAGEERASLGRLDSRLAGLLEAVAGLEAAQSEGMRQLGSTLSAALADSQEALAATVRGEAWNSMEALRQLPAALAAAAPGGLGAQLSEETVRAVVGEQMESVVRQLAEQQQVLLAEAGSRTATIAPTQWNQLGKRLVALDGQLEELRREQQRNGEGVAAALEAVKQLQAVRADLSTLAAAVQTAFEKALGAGGAEALPAGALEGTMAEAMGTFSALCAKLDGFAAQLAVLKQGLDQLPAAAASAAAAVDALDAARAVAAVESASKTRRDAAYEADVRSGNGASGSEERWSEPEAGTPEVEVRGEGGAAEPESSGVPISSWLSLDEQDGQDAQPQLEAQVVGSAATGMPLAGSSSSPGAQADVAAAGSGSGGVEAPSTAASGNGGGAAVTVEIEATSADVDGAAAPAAEIPQVPLEALPPEEAYQRGLQLLRRGRALAAAPGGDWGAADQALRQAAECFDAALRSAPDDVRALGNYGNVLLAHGSLKAEMMGAVLAGAADAGADGHARRAASASQQRLAAEAQELLVLAGRRFRGVLELDPGQARAFVNWGRVICLRAELARSGGDLSGAAALFANAADKFAAVLDLGEAGGAARTARLAGVALMCAGLSAAGEDPARGRGLMGEAEGYLAAAAAEDPSDGEARSKLDECRAWLASY